MRDFRWSSARWTGEAGMCDHPQGHGADQRVVSQHDRAELQPNDPMGKISCRLTPGLSKPETKCVLTFCIRTVHMNVYSLIFYAIQLMYIIMFPKRVWKLCWCKEKNYALGLWSEPGVKLALFHMQYTIWTAYFSIVLEILVDQLGTSIGKHEGGARQKDHRRRVGVLLVPACQVM